MGFLKIWRTSFFFFFWCGLVFDKGYSIWGPYWAPPILGNCGGLQVHKALGFRVFPGCCGSRCVPGLFLEKLTEHAMKTRAISEVYRDLRNAVKIQ